MPDILPPEMTGMTITERTISVVIDGKFRSVRRESRQGVALEALLKGETPVSIEEVREALDTQKWIAKLTFGRLVIDDDDQMRLDGRSVDFGLTQAILKVHTSGLPVEPLAAFAENVANNPNPDIAKGLYPYLIKGEHPITPDGCFLAWKNVRENFFSHHSGREDWYVHMNGELVREGHGGQVWHPVGGTISIPREQCDESPHRTCSVGLHACSHEYLKSYISSPDAISLLVKINPADVTSFPHGGEAKLRTCRYEIVDSLKNSETAERLKGGIDDTYTPEVATDTVDWHRRGRDDGYSDGHSDGLSGEPYDADLTLEDYPEELRGKRPGGREFSSYLSGYLAGYHDGHAQGAADLAEEEAAAEPDEDDLIDAEEGGVFEAIETEEQATAAGARDGDRYAAGDSYYDCDHTSGEQFHKVPEVLVDYYHRAFNVAYEKRFSRDN